MRWKLFGWGWGSSLELPLDKTRSSSQTKQQLLDDETASAAVAVRGHWRSPQWEKNASKTSMFWHMHDRLI
jgi:hypothetical protein